MKTGLRIFIILVAAGLIGGVTLLLVSNGSTSASGLAMEQPLDGAGGRHLPDSDGFVPGAFPVGSGRVEHSGFGEWMDDGAFSWAESVKNIVIVAVLVILVVMIERSLKRRKEKRVVQVPVRTIEPDRKE